MILNIVSHYKKYSETSKENFFIEHVSAVLLKKTDTEVIVNGEGPNKNTVLY